MRGRAGANATPLTLTVKALPFSVDDIVQDQGGDSRWVTTTISGSRFQPGALVKLVRPGIAEIEPTRYAVLDATTIVATWDLRNQPHGLYDVAVINPDGATAGRRRRGTGDQAAVPAHRHPEGPGRHRRADGRARARARKIRATDANRGELLKVVELSKGRIVDLTAESVMVEVTGTEAEVDEFVALVRTYGIKELVRTGAVVMTRGAVSIEEALKR